MTRQGRAFAATDAVRQEVPLLVGLMGPSGGGKTYSALRLATGIQRVRGGDIYVIDTEANRALHYADTFKFKHVPFTAPFGSLDYLDALAYCHQNGAGVVIVDSMSHEHEGAGGYLEFHDKELDRMAGDDYQKRERVNFAAWIKPAASRRALINGLLQMNAAFIFCFRAKEKTKPNPGGKPIELGFSPIAGDEFLFEMTVNALLPPNAGGVPTWNSDKVGEKLMIKLPGQFRAALSDGKPLSEEHGRVLAEWARGATGGSMDPEKAAGLAAPAPTLDERIAKLERALNGASSIEALESAWKRGDNILRSREIRRDRRAQLELTYESRYAELQEAQSKTSELSA